MARARASSVSSEVSILPFSILESRPVEMSPAPQARDRSVRAYDAVCVSAARLRRRWPETCPVAPGRGFFSGPPPRHGGAWMDLRRAKLVRPIATLPSARISRIHLVKHQPPDGRAPSLTYQRGMVRVTRAGHEPTNVAPGRRSLLLPGTFAGVPFWRLPLRRFGSA